MKLLLDLGASRIKCCLSDEQGIVKSASLPSPSVKNYSTVKNHYTVPKELYRDSILSLLNDLYTDAVTGVYVCTEMHGFLLGSQYISWKDNRAKFTTEQAKTFFDITGMKLRPGIAYATLLHEAIENNKIGTLLDTFLDSPATHINISLAASLGFVDKNTKQYSSQLLKNEMGTVTTDLTRPIGTVTVQGKQLPVYGGVGDLQAALLGCGIGKNVDAVINLGTGSQVVCTTDVIDNHEIRPMPNGSYVKVITHIPCGRALTIIAENLGTNRFWSTWQNLTSEKVLTTDPNQAQLSFFESAWNYSPQSGYIKFQENQTFEDLVAAIAHSWVMQYVKCLEVLDSKKEKFTVLLAGGVSHKTQFFKETIEEYSNRNFIHSKTVTGEETLDGLLNL